MLEDKFSIDALVNAVEEDVTRIRTGHHSFDIFSYLNKWLPMAFPNKGVIALAKAGRIVQIHHELFNIRKFLGKERIENLETLIDCYGSTHERDYCYLVLGHRYKSSQAVHFRGVLGVNRLHKLMLALRLAGFSKAQLRIVDHQPNYDTIIRHDLRTLPNLINEVLIGGEVVLGSYLSNKFTSVVSTRGSIISCHLYTYKRRQILLTSFPYGNLCKMAIKGMAERGVRSLCFVGSAGAIKSQLKIGDIIAPVHIANEKGQIVSRKFNNRFVAEIPRGVKTTRLHGNIKTPLIETSDRLKRLAQSGCETIDVEAAHFQEGCEQFLSKSGKVGVLLYVIDRPRSTRTLAQHDYSRPDIVSTRRRIAHLMELWLNQMVDDTKRA